MTVSSLSESVPRKSLPQEGDDRFNGTILKVNDMVRWHGWFVLLQGERGECGTPGIKGDRVSCCFKYFTDLKQLCFP